MRKIGFILILLLWGIRGGSAEVNVLQPQLYPGNLTISGSVVLPEENRIGILPLKLVGYAKELPSADNFTRAIQSIASQITQLLGNPTEIFDTPAPDKIKNKPATPEQLAKWAVTNFKATGVRTIVYVTLDLKRGSAPAVTRFFGVPVGMTKYQTAMWVTAKPKLEMLIIDLEMGVPVAKIGGEFPYSGGSIIDYVKGNLRGQLRSKLAEEVDFMIMRAVSDLVVECRVERLLMQRPRISLAGIQNRKVTLAAGSDIGINEKSEFYLFAPDGDSMKVVGRLRAKEVAPTSTLCSLRKIRKQDPNTAEFAFPVLTKTLKEKEERGKRSRR